MDRVAPEVRSRIMAAIRSRDTKPERDLRSIMRRAGLRFRTNVRSLPGSPDIVSPAHRLAVFMDGDFWHGRGKLPASNAEFWRAKFARNAERDRENDRDLAALGWRVVRIWESDLRADPAACAVRIMAALRPPAAGRARKPRYGTS